MASLTNSAVIDPTQDGHWPHIVELIGNFRKTKKDWGGNFALVKFSCRDNKLSGFVPLGGENGRWFYYLVARSDQDLSNDDNYNHHSEKLLIEQLQAVTGTTDVKSLKVHYVFTEREPCTGKYGLTCHTALANFLERYGDNGVGTEVRWLAAYPNSDVVGYKATRSAAAGIIKAAYP